MRMFMLGAATIALAATTAYADPGKGGGGGGHGGGNGGPHAAAGNPGGFNGGGGNNGGGQAKGNGGGQAKGNGGGHGPAAQAPAPTRGNGGGMKAERAPAPQRAAKVERGSQGGGNGNGKANAAVQQAPQRQAAVRDDRGPDRGNGNGNGNGKAKADAYRGQDVRVVRGDRGPDVVVRDGRSRVVRTWVNFDRDASRGLISGCPPGLAKKNNGCMPPGLAQQRQPTYYRPSWFGYSSYNDGRYYYDDGYLYRTSNTGSILGYIPLLGGALSVGNQWPDYYDPYPVPDYYVDYYNLGSPGSYRYADDVLYRVDPQNDAITSIAALLTGDQFGIGQRMPAGYDVYNVPYGYRDQYYDTPEYDYRYSDGYIYQVDPTTQLIQAAIQLLV